MTVVNASDLTAKLLATENLTVVRSPSKTASFDVLSRVLNLPLWKDMTPEIESLFVQHEVGHALFTDQKIWMSSIDAIEDRKTQRIMRGYMNVVEDARIEKLMKRRFPGSRKSFFSGYKQLLERDFFGLKNKDVNDMLLIDRINLYFKGGLTLGVKFSDEEKALVNKVDRCETMEEMVVIAKEIHEYSLTTAAALKKESATAKLDIDFDDDDIFDEDEEDLDDMDAISSGLEDNELLPNETQESLGEVESNSPGKTSVEDPNGVDEDEIESETDKNLNEKLEELADTSTDYRYYEVDTRCWQKDPIIGFKQVLKDTVIVDEKIAEAAREYGYNHKKDFDTFMIESERMVNYLVKEFEMRKSAQAYRRAQTSKSGSLNMNKIHAYKITDDIFKRVTSIPDGKNHGMIFLLDWSGSMQGVIDSTVRQVINLAMFCRRINIPFEVYAFTGQYFGKKLAGDVDYEASHSFNHAMRLVDDKNIVFSDGFFNLLNIFSSKMNNLEFQTAARRFTSYYINQAEGYSMGDTPLNEALVHMLKFIPEYKRRNNIEKLTMITLSDGAGGALLTNKRLMNFDYERTSVDGNRLKIKNFMRDEETGKTYEMKDQSYNITEILLKMIKERNGITVLGFYICENRRRVLDDAFKDHFGKRASEYEIETMRKYFRQDGFYSMKGTGRDDLFIIPDTSTKIIDEDLQVDDNMSASQIAKKFAKNMGNRKHSRILLDKFIGYVA